MLRECYSCFGADVTDVSALKIPQGYRYELDTDQVMLPDAVPVRYERNGTCIQSNKPDQNLRVHRARRHRGRHRALGRL